MASSIAASRSSRPFLLPEIPELFNKDFLDILIPPTSASRDVLLDDHQATPAPTNPMMDALKATSNRVLTDNWAAAYSSTGSPTLDAFQGISRYTFATEMEQYLDEAWKEDPSVTLRIIWNLRSIHDGKGEKEAFYRAFGWLYDNHPRTAIINLHLLVDGVCAPGKKKAGKAPTAHGYWKDLLNILALATVGELSGLKTTSEFLHTPRMPFTYGRNKDKTKAGTPASRIASSLAQNAKAKADAVPLRKAKEVRNHQRLVTMLSEPKYRALFIAVARLFADQLIKDVKVLDELEKLEPGEGDRIALLKTISLAGKWAPTPDLSHDRVTNIATAISELIYASQAFQHPSALRSPLPAEERGALLRSFYQRWILTELRRAAALPEPLMSANRWKEIKYNRVASVCMQNNTPHFFRHDPEGFEAYLTSVETNKKSISGATLLPHELVGKVVELGNTAAAAERTGRDKAPKEMQAFKQRLAAAELRVVEAQWKALINSLRESGSIDNALAVCDVSGSMGYLGGGNYKKHVQPILPAISLSLVLASLAKPPFNGGFITFSERPQFVQLDLEQSLYDQVTGMSRAHWTMNTDLQRVFVDLILPLAIRNNVKQEDMIKRLFVFSDMQFDSTGAAGKQGGRWETNYDAIERRFREAGYEMPEIVYWNLAGEGGTKTVEVESGRRGVALMNGFSSAMLKVFMGEQEEAVEEEGEQMEWEAVSEDGESVTVAEKAEKRMEEFNPVNVMLKALGVRSFEGLVVVD
ncbi:hypothetical protein GALMADRAFT_255745 [Galerina marginata CBS 339.88]|uniref:DUF2828 domain-containing protein n=1 Tax=Galerina marginata (strain CBS 339.88) TaxID=685588 RepID=A0A067SQB8_GALM3|nr:hypothetical protein GALMADRAFT_255745 [Galerina marginata CBS 339.88]